MAKAPNKVSAGNANIGNIGPDSNLFKGKDFNAKASKQFGAKVFAAQYIKNNFQLKIKPREKEKA